MPTHHRIIGVRIIFKNTWLRVESAASLKEKHHDISHDIKVAHNAERHFERGHNLQQVAPQARASINLLWRCDALRPQAWEQRSRAPRLAGRASAAWLARRRQPRGGPGRLSLAGLAWKKLTYPPP